MVPTLVPELRRHPAQPAPAVRRLLAADAPGGPGGPAPAAALARRRRARRQRRGRDRHHRRARGDVPADRGHRDPGARRRHRRDGRPRHHRPAPGWRATWSSWTRAPRRPPDPGVATRAAALVKAAHPGPCVAVTAVGTALGAMAGAPAGPAYCWLRPCSTGQLSIGWCNDAVDRGRDVAAGRTDKPLAVGTLERTHGVDGVRARGRRVRAALARARAAAGVTHLVAVGRRVGVRPRAQADGGLVRAVRRQLRAAPVGGDAGACRHR